MGSAEPYQLSNSSNVGQVSIFTNAKDIQIKNSAFHITSVYAASNSATAFERLYERVAPNAILNEGGRWDDARCHPGTREEVIGIIEGWLNAPNSDHIVWLTGPAGGGKTAIVKTLAERYLERGAQTVNFFFFRGDSTRNTSLSLVPTLLYQLFQQRPALTEEISRILTAHPRILDASVPEQFKLIQSCIPLILPSIPAGSQIILLVDGLDECNDLDAARAHCDILCALYGLVTLDSSPFRVLVASRPEAHIQMTFNQHIPSFHHLFLDEDYSPAKDIERFVTAEFARLKRSHPSAHLLPADWPEISDVKSIVKKSSGQFIYAATVMRYISHASTVPSVSLERIKGISIPTKISPFAHLDGMYSLILARADAPEAVRDIFAMTFLHPGRVSMTDVLSCYNPCYSRAFIESCISELSAIVRLDIFGNLELYHASLRDFLLDKERSTLHCVDVDSSRVQFLIGLWRKPPIMLDHTNVQLRLMEGLRAPSPEITQMLLKQPFAEWTIGWKFRDPGSSFLQSIHHLYYTHDSWTYQCVLRRYIRMFLSNNIRPRVDGIPYGGFYILLYCFKLLRFTKNVSDVQ